MEPDPNPASPSSEAPHDEAGILAEEEAYWRENHDAQPYANGRGYPHFRSAYRSAIAGYVDGRTFEQQEDPLRTEYESMKESGGHRSLEEEAIEQLEWDEARHAAQAAYGRMAARQPKA